MMEFKKPFSSLLIAEEDEGKRLDEFLVKATSLSRAQVVRMIEGGTIRIQGEKTKKGVRLVAGQNILFWAEPMDAQNTPPIPQPELPLDVLFENEHIVVVNKPAGWPSHPLIPLEKNTLASALVARYKECSMASEYAREGGLCHRLDRFTSGVVIAARTKKAWQAIRQAFQDGKVQKEYLAICQGKPQAEQGEITEPLIPVPGKKDRMQVAKTLDEKYSEHALSATTHFKVLNSNENYSLLHIVAVTGRRHQIRVHLAYIGLPLVGDVQYGGSKLKEELAHPFLEQNRQELQGQFLHASKVILPPLLEINQPQSLVVEAPLSETRQRLLKQLLSVEKEN